MKQLKSSKRARQLPARSALNDLNNSQRTISDYGKHTPVTPSRPTPNLIQNLIPRATKE